MREERPDGTLGRRIPADRRILEFRDAVRRAWKAPDKRSRLYAVIPMLARFARREGSPESAIERALFYLLDDGHLARVCGNAECPAPYYWARRPNQKYCSGDCALPAQRETKLRWWQTKGAERRRAAAARRLKKR
jgi:hypothetical protein